MLSRVADSLYWLARYIERAENNARILDVNLQVTLDDDHRGEDGEKARLGADPRHARGPEAFPLALRRDQRRDGLRVRHLRARKIPTPSAPASPARGRMPAPCASTFPARCGSASTASTSGSIPPTRASSSRAAPSISYRHVVDYSHQFHGTTDATLTHGEGWNFLQVGKYLERADSTSRILDLKYHILLPSGEQVGGNVDTVQWQAVLKSCSAFEAYRKAAHRTGHAVERRGIHHPPRQLSALDPLLRRRTRRRAAPHLGLRSRALFPTRPSASPAACVSDLNYATIADIFHTGLHQYLDSIQGRLNESAAAMHKEYCEWLEVGASTQGAAQA